jgi:hypothetical protein
MSDNAVRQIVVASRLKGPPRTPENCHLGEVSMSATQPGPLLRCRGSGPRGTNAPPFRCKFNALANGQSAGGKKAERVHVRAPPWPCCCAAAATAPGGVTRSIRRDHLADALARHTSPMPTGLALDFRPLRSDAHTP